MNRFTISISVTLIALFATGCARVKFYSDPGLKKETGLTYFEPKPYLLITKSNQVASVQVVYLPDKTKPQYAVYKSGFGSHKFNLAIQNGILASYGQEADSKIPE